MSADADTRDLTRLFFALRLSTESASALAKMSSKLASVAKSKNLSIDWIHPLDYHVTLKFVGWVQRELLYAFQDQVPSHLSGIKSFSLNARGLGVFPKAETSRVLWAGFGHPPQELGQLAEELEILCAGLGIAASENTFVPHVTLGRSKSDFDGMSLIHGVSEQAFSKSRIQSIELLESSINTKGCRYKKITSWALD